MTRGNANPNKQVVNGRWRLQFVEWRQHFKRPQGWEGEAAVQNEVKQPASANEEGKSRMDDNQGNIQGQ
jgi:hypothetical protein